MTETTKTDPEAVDFTFELSDREISFDLDE